MACKNQRIFVFAMETLAGYPYTVDANFMQLVNMCETNRQNNTEAGYSRLNHIERIRIKNINRKEKSAIKQSAMQQTH